MSTCHRFSAGYGAPAQTTNGLHRSFSKVFFIAAEGTFLIAHTPTHGPELKLTMKFVNFLSLIFKEAARSLHLKIPWDVSKTLFLS